MSLRRLCNLGGIKILKDGTFTTNERDGSHATMVAWKIGVVERHKRAEDRDLRARDDTAHGGRHSDRARCQREGYIMMFRSAHPIDAEGVAMVAKFETVFNISARLDSAPR
jgi:hypothetical protein